MKKRFLNSNQNEIIFLRKGLYSFVRHIEYIKQSNKILHITVLSEEKNNYPLLQYNRIILTLYQNFSRHTHIILKLIFLYHVESEDSSIKNYDKGDTLNQPRPVRPSS